MSLINKLADWPPNYHKTARTFPKSSAPPHSMNKLSQQYCLKKIYFIMILFVSRKDESLLNTSLSSSFVLSYSDLAKITVDEKMYYFRLLVIHPDD